MTNTAKGWARELLAATEAADLAWERAASREEWLRACERRNDAARAFLLATMPASDDRDFMVGSVARMSVVARRKVLRAAADMTWPG